MTDAWEHASELADQHAANGGLFVKLANDGDKVVGVFLGDPYAREVHWDGERYVVCEGKERCEHCDGGVKASLRTSMNFYVIDEDAVKIIEGGVAWFKDLLKCREKYGLTKWSFEIERHGAAKSPKTSYSILPDEQLSEEDRQRYSKLELHDLRSVLAGDGAEDGEHRADSKEKNAGKPIETRDAELIAARLRAAPKDVVGAFLKKFGVARIRELKGSDVKGALAFLDAKAPANEIDPFE
jgi:hypothetical protein